MRRFLTIALVGLGAQLVDGALGMGYGATSTSFLLVAGMTPAWRASVHLAEVGTNLASGVSRWHLDNVDWRLVARIGVPGAIGALAGATFLSTLSTEAATPLMALILQSGLACTSCCGTCSSRRRPPWPRHRRTASAS